MFYFHLQIELLLHLDLIETKGFQLKNFIFIITIFITVSFLQLDLDDEFQFDLIVVLGTTEGDIRIIHVPNVNFQGQSV